MATKKGPHRGQFRPVAEAGPDPRRHVFTLDERRRGGLACARKFTCRGRWHPDWWDRCRRKRKNPKGEYVDAAEETAEPAGGRGGTPR